MPITAAKGQINIILEALTNQGMTTLLSNASPAASMSLTTQPVNSVNAGSRLVVWVMNAPQAGNGTFTLTGLDINGNALSEGPITVPAPSVNAQSAIVGKFEYVTTKIFASINASGLTTTNLASTGATITVLGVQGAKFLVPGVLKTKKKPEKFSPNEHRNLLDKDTKRMQTKNVVTLDELSQVVYPENSLWVAYMVTGSAPTVTLVQPTSTVTLASAKTTSPFSLTTQPVAPGQLLQFVVSGATGFPGTIAIAGKDQAGNAVTENITVSANTTYTSTKVYSSINTNGITVSTITGYSINVNGLATPTNLMPLTAVSGSPLSLTTQPTAPGMGLVFYTTAVGASGSIAISGTDINGNSISETITIPNTASSVYYSSNIYKTVTASGITITGMTGGSIWVNGTYGYQYVFLPGDTVYSACIEKFTGVDSFSLPWVMIEEATFEFGMDKEFKLSTKGIAQDRLVIGDRTASLLNTNRVTALGQPGDLPMVGWSMLVYIDTTAGAVPTTQFGDLLEGKISLKSPQKPGWTATNSQNYNRVNRGKRETMFDAKIDLTNVLQLEQHRLNNLQYITFQFLGQAIGGGNNKTWQFTFPARWDDFDIVSTPDMERVEATVQSVAEYDSGLGGAYKLTIINQQPPIYTA